MYDGVIQQVAEPLDVYDKPVNRFVAGFLGTPPMNFFDGIVRFKNNNACFIIGKQEIFLADRTKGALAAYKDKQMVLGIRPEHLLPQYTGGQNQKRIDCIVMVVEPLGDRMNVYLQTERGDRFVANVDPDIKIGMNQAVTMYIDTEKVNTFELGDTGKNVYTASR
jgi:multiple sugar transport system ATP-binding protein